MPDPKRDARGTARVVLGLLVAAVMCVAFVGFLAWWLLFDRTASEVENALDDLQADQGVVLVYEATGDVAAATVRYSTTADVEEEVAALPWTKEFTVMGAFRGGTLDVTTGPDGGTVTCRVTVDGVEKRTATASGPDAVAECSDF
ncbi:MmpS family membrane protein [Saccharothrix carnea]|uniref:MmpS family membrane protein n=1 Tax=Saccharothrix carnea TaxID=1280637 RepID=A0A2P8I8P1_SACCR|nr:MmpS family transport accessory protein [Saccharothrix carnea]PSL54832.1 MmpS family membrane protein [Saccharothrix carnea]